MRVTENRLMNLGAEGVGRAREKLGQAQQVMSSGMRVGAPSDDPSGWAQGARAAAGTTLAGAHGRALGRARDGLQQTDDALNTIGDTLSRLRETTLQAANETLAPEDRKRLAELARTLGGSALAASNTRGPDGEYLFAGTRGDAAAYDPTTAYQGDELDRKIDLGGAAGAVTVNGAGLASTLPLFERVAQMLEANDVAGLRDLLPEITAAIDGVATTRTTVGARMEALDVADSSRQSFELRLAASHQRAVEADPITAASNLARSASALEAARMSAEAVLAAVRR